jgi:hypothetical protein
MADLNALIAQGAQFAAPVDPFAQYGKMQQLQQGETANQLNRMKMEEMQAANTERNALRQLDPTSPDYESQLFRVNPTMGIAYRKEAATAAAQQATQKAQQAEALKTNLANHRSFLVGVNDQPAYDAWRALTIKNIPDLASILPKQFLPETKDSLLKTADDISKRLTAAPPTPLNVSRLIKERDALLPGDPNIEIYNDAIRKETQFAPRAITNVNVPPQEKAERAERGKLLVTEYSDISKAARLAAKTLPSIDANLSILNKGFSTGFGTETIAAGASVLSALGVPNAEKFATNAQVFQAKATEAVLQKQLEQKGPQTESDAQRIDQIGAQLGKTTAGNKFVLTTAKEQLKRDMEQRNFYDTWWKTNKTYDGAEDALYSGEGGKSLFDRPALKEYIKTTETPAANRPSLDSIFKSPPAAGAKGK